ncbi:mediator of RNA polymerase ii transcription subunit [Anaeramoeba flamelloides]|uniref:Mediator of RNA polymerase ii transcription subunit n=1 Tax=Anaeramoeba flamelloides TaxID=1746091 RepID=A0AAV7YL21_9EUKA|nr:mediator of RNA polymerase ii transcription subunit [Anaeramoeba flamelloides]
MDFDPLSISLEEVEESEKLETISGVLETLSQQFASLGKKPQSLLHSFSNLSLPTERKNFDQTLEKLESFVINSSQIKENLTETENLKTLSRHYHWSSQFYNNHSICDNIQTACDNCKRMIHLEQDLSTLSSKSRKLSKSLGVLYKISQSLGLEFHMEIEDDFVLLTLAVETLLIDINFQMGGLAEEVNIVILLGDDEISKPEYSQEFIDCLNNENVLNNFREFKFKLSCLVKFAELLSKYQGLKDNEFYSNSQKKLEQLINSKISKKCEGSVIFLNAENEDLNNSNKYKVILTLGEFNNTIYKNPIDNQSKETQICLSLIFRHPLIITKDQLCLFFDNLELNDNNNNNNENENTEIRSSKKNFNFNENINFEQNPIFELLLISNPNKKKRVIKNNNEKDNNNDNSNNNNNNNNNNNTKNHNNKNILTHPWKYIFKSKNFIKFHFTNDFHHGLVITKFPIFQVENIPNIIKLIKQQIFCNQLFVSCFNKKIRNKSQETITNNGNGNGNENQNQKMKMKNCSVNISINPPKEMSIDFLNLKSQNLKIQIIISIPLESEIQLELLINGKIPQTHLHKECKQHLIQVLLKEKQIPQMFPIIFKYFSNELTDIKNKKRRFN